MAPSPAGPAGPSTYPVPRKVPVERSHHGHTVVDDYEWMRVKDDPAVLAHLEAENAWTAARTAHLAGLRDDIFEEIRGRTRETDLSVPYRIGGWWYYGRTTEGKQYGASCRCPAAGADDWTPPHVEPGVPAPGEELLLDLEELAAGHDFFALGGATVSPDGTRLAYSVDTVGDERFTLRVKDLTSGEVLPDEVPGTVGGAVWDLGGTTLFYVTVDDAWRADKVWRHVLGTPVSEDVLVHHETDEQFRVGIGRTRSDRFLVLACGSSTTTEMRVLEADDPTGQFRLVAPRRPGVEYAVDHAVLRGEDRLLVVHNDGAVNFACATAPVTASSPTEWVPLLPHDEGVRLLDVDPFAGHLVVSRRTAGRPDLAVLLLDDAAPDGIGEEVTVDLGGEVRSIGPSSNPEFEQPTVRFGLTTLASPPSVHELDLRTRETRLLKQTEVLGDFDPTRYEEHRTWATGDDGTRVPVSVVVPAGAPRDGSVPVVLYGYGAYEDSTDPWFSVARLSLLDRGVGFAIAHVRGGGELGRPWYDDGKMLNKRNSFTDFVACARHLVAEGWTSADRLVAEGESAGGLLVGAAVNLAPDAFAGVLAEVPFVDALTTMLDPTLPLTVPEWEEWGNPLADAAVYDYMAGYAPYDNVREGRYPKVLATTSVHDTRVLYVEPAKWVARLRERVGNPEDVLLKVETSAGHGGVSGRYDAWRDRAFTLAWVLDVLGRAGSVS